MRAAIPSGGRDTYDCSSLIANGVMGRAYQYEAKMSSSSSSAAWRREPDSCRRRGHHHGRRKVGLKEDRASGGGGGSSISSSGDYSRIQYQVVCVFKG